MSSITQIEQSLSTGSVARAEQQCLACLATDPENPELLTLLALCEEANNLTEQAVARLQNVCRRYPESARAHFHAGRLALARGELQAAETALSKVVSLEPNHAPSRHLLARMALQSGRLKAAIEGCKTALKADPGYLPAHCDLALAYLEAERLADAMDAATHALKLSRDSAEAHLVMGSVLLAQNEPLKAGEHLTRATDLDPDSSQGLLLLAKSYQRMHQHLQALTALDRLSGVDKQRVEARKARAVSLTQLGQTRLAQELWEGVVGQVLDVDAVLQLMEIHIHHQDTEALSALHKRLSDHDQTESDLTRLVAAVHCAMDHQSAVAGPMFQALLDSPMDSVALRAALWSARLYLADNEPQKAIVALQQVSEACFAQPGVSLQIAQLAEQAGDVGFSLQCVERALALNFLPEDLENALTAQRDRLQSQQPAK